MKLLTTIAAVLISISAYSQNIVEYDKGTFSQNGEELSMEQIDDLTLSYNTGIGNFRKGNNFNRMHKNLYLRTNNNILNFLVGSAAAIGGVPWAALGGAVVLSGDEDYIAVGFVLLGLGTGLCAVSYKALSRIALSPAGCLPKRDEQFKKVADKINQAIAAGGPSVQPSNDSIPILKIDSSEQKGEEVLINLEDSNPIEIIAPKKMREEGVINGYWEMNYADKVILGSPGYYLVSGIYKSSGLANRMKDAMSKKGIQTNLFRDKKNNMFYLYILKFDDSQEAENAKSSGLNKQYKGKLWIKKIE